MLRAIHKREGRWGEVDPDTEVARIGEGTGLSEDQSYELFGHLVDEGFVDPGRAYRAGGAMPGSASRIVGRGHHSQQQDAPSHERYPLYSTAARTSPAVSHNAPTLASIATSRITQMSDI